MQLKIVDTDGREFRTGNSTFIRISIDHDLLQLRNRKKELEQEIRSAQL